MATEIAYAIRRIGTDLYVDDIGPCVDHFGPWATAEFRGVRNRAKTYLTDDLEWVPVLARFDEQGVLMGLARVEFDGIGYRYVTAPRDGD